MPAGGRLIAAAAMPQRSAEGYRPSTDEHQERPVPRISRSRRAEIQRQAQLVRQHGQRVGWDIERIAEAILARFPEVLALEAWRLAYGWSRRQAVDGIAVLYVDDGLAPPPVNTSMLCRWEHDDVAVCFEYATALVRLYRATPAQLGLGERTPAITLGALRACYGRPYVADLASVSNGSRYRTMTASSDNDAALAAVRESIQLALDVEGPTGGPSTVEQLQAAVEYYALNYSVFPPAQLATEIHRCRALVAAALRSEPGPDTQIDLRRSAGWLSALLGNLAFHLADYPAARIHLATAGRLGEAVGDDALVAWSYGAQSMIAQHLGQPVEALGFAQRALESVDTPLARAQILAWAQLRALAQLGRAVEAHNTIRDAQRAMDADPAGGRPGRFGFDRAELELHIAEAHLLLGEPSDAADHANASITATRHGGAGWAAATTVLAQAEALHDRPDQAAQLAHSVLDTISPPALRQTSRRRLQVLDRRLQALTQPGPPAQDLHGRLIGLPPLPAPTARSDEPNGPENDQR